MRILISLSSGWDSIKEQMKKARKGPSNSKIKPDQYYLETVNRKDGSISKRVLWTVNSYNERAGAWVFVTAGQQSSRVRRVEEHVLKGLGFKLVTKKQAHEFLIKNPIGTELL